MFGNLEEVKKFFYNKVYYPARYRIAFTLLQRFGFQGLFGYAFRSISCVSKMKVCDGCHYAPHPFVILLPLNQRRHYGAENLLEITLVLIGKGADLFPYFVYAFKQMGRIGAGKERGKFTVEEVKDLELDFRGLIDFSAKIKTVRNDLRRIDLRRYSGRQKRKLLLGEVVFEGDLDLLGRG